MAIDETIAITRLAPLLIVNDQLKSPTSRPPRYSSSLMPVILAHNDFCIADGIVGLGSTFD